MIKQKLNYILNSIEKLDLKIKCFSFDVFDTLVHRKIAPPDQVMVPAARSVVKILHSFGIKESLMDCMKIRQRVTRRLQSAAYREGYDPECHIREIINAWLQHYLPSQIAAENWRAVLSEELKAEEAVCIPLQGMKEIVKKIKKSGKRILFISDMYLGIQEISSFLVAAGYDNLFDAGYVSADIKLSKKSGRLFNYVLNHEDISASEMFHIGDDYLADFLSPRKIGIRASQFQDPDQDKWSYRHRKLYRLARNNESWEGARWVNMIPPASNSKQVSRQDFPYALGLCLIGPLFANFIHQTILRILQKKSQLVLLPSREGFILKRIYDQLLPQIAADGFPTGHYVFLSRKATFLPSISKFGPREVKRGFNTNATLKGFLNKINLEPEEFEDVAHKCGFINLEEPVELLRDGKRLQTFFEHPDFIKKFTCERDTQRELLYDNLNQLGFWQAERVAIVDVGWDGSIQEALSLAFEEKENFPRMDGYYIALLGRTPHPCIETEKSKFHGILHDYRSDFNRTGIGRFTELFESAARAFHGTTLRYDRDIGSIIRPILEASNNSTRKAEMDDSHLVASIQAGILEYVDRYSEWIEFQDQPPETHSQYILELVDRFVRFPTRAESLQLRSLTLGDDFEGTASSPKRSLSFSANQSTGTNAESDPFRWSEGLYASMKLPGMHYLFNIYRAIFKEPY